MPRLPVIALLFTFLAVALAGCGGDDPKPDEPKSAVSLLVSSLRDTSKLKDPKVRYKLNGTLEVKAGPGADETTQRLASGPMRVSAEGGLSETAVTAKGRFQGMGMSYDAEALLGEREVFVKFLGAWYGSEGTGLADAGQQATAEQRAQFDRLLAQAELAGSRALDMNVGDGPHVDGADTWKAAGTLNPEGVAQLAAAKGEAMTAEERQILARVSEDLRFEVLIGKGDNLLRSLTITLDGSPNDWDPTAEAVEEVERIKLTFDLKLTKWGEVVTYDAPEAFTPLDEMNLDGLDGDFLDGFSNQSQDPQETAIKQQLTVAYKAAKAEAVINSGLFPAREQLLNGIRRAEPQLREKLSVTDRPAAGDIGICASSTPNELQLVGVSADGKSYALTAGASAELSLVEGGCGARQSSPAPSPSPPPDAAAPPIGVPGTDAPSDS